MRRRDAILTITLLLAFSMLIQHSISAQLLLLKRAHPVSGGRFRISEDTHSFALHFWLSQSIALVVFKDPNSRLQVRRLDTRTGHVSALKGLGPGLAGQEVMYHGTLVPDALSPDGRWLLGLRDTTLCTYEAVGVTNRQHKVWRSSDDPTSSYGTVDVHWLPDSRHWFYWDDDEVPPRMMVYSLHGKHSSPWRVMGLPGPERGKRWRGGVGLVMGLNAEHKVILMAGDATYSDGGEVRVYSFAPAPNTRARLIASFRLPHQLPTVDVILSPKGDRLAWLCRHYREDPEGVGWSLWVSNLDGSHLREIGRTPYYEAPIHLWLSDVQWKPNGREISFFLQHRLWTVAVGGK